MLNEIAKLLSAFWRVQNTTNKIPLVCVHFYIDYFTLSPM